MSLLPGLPNSSLNMFNNAILPYTFTTGELEQLKTKLLSADNQMSAAKQQTGMLNMSISEIRTLLRMIDMTYLQGLRYETYLIYLFWYGLIRIIHKLDNCFLLMFVFLMYFFLIFTAAAKMFYQQYRHQKFLKMEI